MKIRDKYSKSTLNWDEVNRITLALVLSTLFWILRALLTSEQACSYTYEDFLHHTIFEELNQRNQIKLTEPIEPQQNQELGTTRTWCIDCKDKNRCIEVIEREVPFVWHPIRILPRFLKPTQYNHFLLLRWWQ